MSGRACPTRNGSPARRPVLLYAFSIFVIFLCLAALYESWTIPISILMALPLGAIGGIIATSLRGLPNGVYFQIGLLTTLGLTAKNAILIVQFAKARMEAGMDLIEATLEGARLQVPPDPDDLAGLRLRRPAAGREPRRRVGLPERHRHQRPRRHDHRHLAGRHLLAAVLRADREALRASTGSTSPADENAVGRHRRRSEMRGSSSHGVWPSSSWAGAR